MPAKKERCLSCGAVMVPQECKSDIDKKDIIIYKCLNKCYYRKKINKEVNSD